MDVEIRNSGSRENEVFSPYKISSLDIWALGITVVIGGQYFSWNEGLEAGLGSYVVGTFLIASAYLSLCLCVSEVTSCLPFAGGAYGLARCTLGLYIGFIVGCCETIEYIVYVATSAILLGSMISTIFPVVMPYQPIIWLCFYLSAILIYSLGGKMFWNFSFRIGVVSLLIVLVYAIGSFQWVDITKNGPIHGEWFIGGTSNFMRIFPLPAWFFVGVETLNFCSDDTDRPKKAIPRGQIACILTLLATATLVLFVTASLPHSNAEYWNNVIAFNAGEMSFLCAQCH